MVLQLLSSRTLLKRTLDKRGFTGLNLKSGRLVHTDTMERRDKELEEEAGFVTILTPTQVKERGIEHFKVLDASFHLPNSGRSALEEYKTLPRIPTAQFFDHELIADTNYTISDPIPNHLVGLGTLKLAHMQPDLFTFKLCMQKLGIHRNHHVLFYDSLGIFSSPRAAWLLNSYGHPKVSVLDGGLPRWMHEKCPLEYDVLSSPTNEPNGSPSSYQMEDFYDENLARQKVISFDALLENFKTTSEDTNRLCILDARSQGRFLGTEPEPRPGISSGHMPASISLPFTSLLTVPKEPEEPYRKFLSVEELEKVFKSTISEGVGDERWEEIKSGRRGVVVSCGSGMTACIIWLALRLCSTCQPHALKVKLYDESWSGYALRNNAVILKSS